MGRNHPVSRRTALATAVPAVAALAGCVGVLDRLSGGSTEEPTFDFPDGFGTDGIDTDAAFGPTAVMATASSLSLHARREVEFPFGTLDHSEVGYFARGPDAFRTESKAFDGLSKKITIASRFYREPTLVERRKVEPRALEYLENRSRYAMNPYEDYGLDELHQLAGDVAFSSPTVGLIEPGHPDQRDGSGEEIPVAVYTAGTADFVPGSLLERASPVLGKFVDGSVEFAVDERGFVHRFEAVGDYETTDGDSTKATFEWDYFDFETTTVTKPDWVGDLPGGPAPEVVVEFEETAGEEVLVRVLSMEHTEHVGVGVAGVGVSGNLTEPGTVVVPADAYLLGDGEVATIAVVAEDAIDGPVRVASYRPAPAGDG